jgi:quercetin dioxygenase-like cupin family protein
MTNDEWLAEEETSMNRVWRIAAVAVLVTLAYVVGRAQGKAIGSGVVSASQATLAESAPWGDFHTYYDGVTTGSAAVLAGTANVKAGMQNHPPHTHVDEEFLYLVEGEGTWTLGDKTMPAHAGDVLYSAPNVLHGLKNTSDKPLKFFVVKWKSR